jgi:tetratricopeptide (TPR) repeat protein
LAAREPVLMTFEDVHWSDPTTREWLDLVIDRVPALHVLLIITFRPESSPPWVGRPPVLLLSLSRLTPRQCAEMISCVTGGKALPREIADQIIERTDGVPLFIEELTKAVVESGVLTNAGDRYMMAGQLPPIAVPTSLNSSLLARLDRLPATREVAQIGAALGRSFSHELIGAVAQMPAQHIDDALAQLLHAELIFQRGTPPDVEYTFKHALVQEAAYGTLLRERRRQLHTRIAVTLEGQFPEIVVAHPALLAQHCAEAGLTEKAVVYWLKAGQQALARSAMAEAVAQLQKGLDLLATLPDGPRRNQQELKLRIALGPALTATKGYSAPDVGYTLARSRALAEQMDEPVYLVRVMIRQWVFHLLRSEHKLALSLAEQIENIARLQLSDAFSEARRLRHGLTLAVVPLLAGLMDWITRSSELKQRAEVLLALSTEHGFPFYLGWATSLRGLSLTMLRQAQEGLTLLTQGLVAIRATGAVGNTPIVLTWIAEAHAMLGQWAEGLKHLAEATQMIEGTDERAYEAEVHRLRGDLQKARGDQAAAEKSYHQVLAVAARQSARLNELRAASSLARLWRDQGKRTEARDLLAPIYGWFTEGFDTPVLQDAKALLDQLV